MQAKFEAIDPQPPRGVRPVCSPVTDRSTGGAFDEMTACSRSLPLFRCKAPIRRFDVARVRARFLLEPAFAQPEPIH